MNELSPILLDLFVLYAGAKIAAEITERVGQPAVIGELLAGVLIGPFGLGLVGNPNAALVSLFHGDEATAREALTLTHRAISELGVVVLLFFVGLETRASDLLEVGRRATLVAVLGIALPFLLGYGLFTRLEYPAAESLFVGAALVATSVGITARVLRDLGVLSSVEARIILGAAVIDDILGLLLLAAVSGIAGDGGSGAFGIALVLAQAVGFTLFLLLVGTRVSARFHPHLDRLRLPSAPFAVAMMLMLGLAALAGLIGLAGIIGAFLAGIVFAEARERFRLEHATRPVYQFLVPFFFVITGTQVNWRLFLDGGVIGLALIVTALAVAGKLVGCGLASVGLGGRSMAIVGVGMVPRGEVGLIVASLGRSLGVLSDSVFSIVVVMSVMTTLIVPVPLGRLYAGMRRDSMPPAGVEAR